MEWIQMAGGQGNGGGMSRDSAGSPPDMNN